MGLGMGLSMVPIINLSMETISNQQMTNASGLQNLLKNIGSAVGTSLVATMLTRFAQMHQYMMVGKLSDLNPVFVERVQQQLLLQNIHISLLQTTWLNILNTEHLLNKLTFGHSWIHSEFLVFFV